MLPSKFATGLVGLLAIFAIVNEFIRPVPVLAFYLPGVAPIDYMPNEPVELKVNRMTSSKTQLPLDYYDLPFCQPEKIKKSAENLGEILSGDRIENTPYAIRMFEDVTCQVLCRKVYTDDDAKKFVRRIEDEYNVNFILDNLPAATQVPLTNSDLTIKLYEHGHRVGGTIIVTDADGNEDKNIPYQHFLYNHLRFTIKFHVPDESSPAARVVGLEIEPFSVNHKYKGPWEKVDQNSLCRDEELAHNFDGDYPQKIDKGGEVIWTYDIKWEESPVKWASRWDVYLSMNNRYDDDVHWFSIINSLLIVVFLTGMVAMILIRALHKDLTRYNMTDEERAEEREESGWKLVHGDVFRPPTWPMLFSVTVGTGSQTFYMCIITLFFAAIGFLSPANRGSLMLALLLCFMFCGIIAGYISARTYNMFNGEQWQRTTLLTATLYPGVVFGILFVLNLVVWSQGSSSAIPFASMLAVLTLWFGISIPLTFLGAYFGYKREVEKQPVATQDIPRQIPEQPWYMSPILTIFVGGILPFGAVFVELFFILSSIWLEQFYYVFGFLLLVFIILVITCAEITIVLTYFALCGEDYRWWWRSVLTSGSSAFYMFVYAGFYFTNKLEMPHFVSAVLYFGYMGVLSLLFFLATGVVGYFACYWFIHKIFSSIKVD